MLDHEDEGFVRVALVVEPGLGFLGDDLGAVAGFAMGAGGVFEIGVVVAALAGKDLPVVEAGGVAGEVPFSDDGGLVACFLEELGEGLLGAVEPGGFVFEEAVFVAVFSGEDGSAAGAANGVGDHAALEEHAFCGDAVEVGRRGDFGERTSVGTECLGGVVVGKDKDNVRAIGGEGCRRQEQGEEEREK